MNEFAKFGPETKISRPQRKLGREAVEAAFQSLPHDIDIPKALREVRAAMDGVMDKTSEEFYAHQARWAALLELERAQDLPRTPASPHVNDAADISSLPYRVEIAHPVFGHTPGDVNAQLILDPRPAGEYVDDTAVPMGSKNDDRNREDESGRAMAA